MEVGITLESELKVTESNTAVAVGSGTLRVLATPAVITLIEETAWKSVADDTDEDCCTVGTGLNIEHLAPTPVGMTVYCRTTLTAVNGRSLTFEAIVNDGNGQIIAKGTHTRFIVNQYRFQEKADRQICK